MVLGEKYFVVSEWQFLSSERNIANVVRWLHFSNGYSSIVSNAADKENFAIFSLATYEIKISIEDIIRKNSLNSPGRALG